MDQVEAEARRLLFLPHQLDALPDASAPARVPDPHGDRARPARLQVIGDVDDETPVAVALSERRCVDHVAIDVDRRLVGHAAKGEVEVPPLVELRRPVGESIPRRAVVRRVALHFPELPDAEVERIKRYHLARRSGDR